MFGSDPLEGLSLQKRQKNEIIKMIQLNTIPPNAKSIDSTVSLLHKKKQDWNNVWKVLIYDDFGKSIITPLLNVQELRKLGVTLHMLLDSNREAIPDVPAVYFVAPTPSSIERIVKDCSMGLYDRMYLNFYPYIKRPEMVNLVESVLDIEESKGSNSIQRIEQIFDQYLNFISFEPDLFSLNEHNSFYNLHKVNQKDSEVEIFIDKIIMSLFSVIVTRGVIPIIRCPKGGAAEMVSRKLDKKLRDRKDVLQVENSRSRQRPLFIILDRDIDVSVCLHHTWTYQALIDDVLGLKQNRVSVNVQTSDSGQATRSYVLDENDTFWVENRGNPYPDIPEAVNKKLEYYKLSVERINENTGKSLNHSNTGNDGDIGLQDMNQELADTISALPELTELKKLIDKHTNLAASLLSALEERKLDEFYSMEDRFLAGNFQAKDRTTLLSMLDKESFGTTEDKARLLLIYFLSNLEENVDSLGKDFELALQDLGMGSLSLKFVSQLKSVQLQVSKSSNIAISSPTSNTFLDSIADRVLSTTKNVAKNMRNLVVSGKALQTAKVVANLMEVKSSTEADTFLYFDPKSLSPSDGTIKPSRNKTPFSEATVFMLGGGNYVEFQNLKDHLNKGTRKITYGSTEIMNPTEFLSQLEMLGKEMK